MLTKSAANGRAVRPPHRTTAARTIAGAGRGGKLPGSCVGARDVDPLADHLGVAAPPTEGQTTEAEQAKGGGFGNRDLDIAPTLA